jgi:hypothetical protein
MKRRGARRYSDLVRAASRDSLAAGCACEDFTMNRTIQDSIRRALCANPLPDATRSGTSSMGFWPADQRFTAIIPRFAANPPAAENFP